ncbi:unnamed protein product [Phytophthora fragariaefolia]|uniref:Unnamed protein product n=1 Tax=Phytophthora fragariaefolia TaxID=1490495 RepID=A0A9W6XNM3_9STRA|nr:unnamed protein product [Phytophthora fragariaefolia]
MLLTDRFKHIGDVSVKIQQIKEGKYGSFFDFHSSLGIGKQRSDYGCLKQQIDQVPVFGFNTGRYDINLIKTDLFADIGTDNINSVIKNPSYMCIVTSNMKMLDSSNYVPAGSSYDKYLTTYIGGCTCDDIITCVCGLGKGLFPYEYITSFCVLSQTTIPPQSAFDSKLRGTSITSDEYERVKFVWEHYEMKSVKDLLVWCNNLDVVPFIKAIKAQRQLFKRFDLDMFTDGVSLPGLSEKVMYQTCFNNLQYSDNAMRRRFAEVRSVRKLLDMTLTLCTYGLGNDMPCGRLTTIETYDGIIDDIVNDKIFGFLECDIRTLDHLKEYFSEMTPIFKNTLIDCTDESVIGKHMFEYNEARKKNRAKPARKLIGSYFGEKS